VVTHFSFAAGSTSLAVAGDVSQLSTPVALRRWPRLLRHRLLLILWSRLLLMPWQRLLMLRRWLRLRRRLLHGSNGRRQPLLALLGEDGLALDRQAFNNQLLNSSLSLSFDLGLIRHLRALEELAFGALPANGVLGYVLAEMLLVIAHLTVAKVALRKTAPALHFVATFSFNKWSIAL